MTPRAACRSLARVHGILFLAYVFLALNLRASVGWDTRTTALVLLGAVLPFGGFVVDRTLLAPAERRLTRA